MSIEITFIAENREDLIAQISDYMDPYRGMAIDVDRGAGTPVKASPRASFATAKPIEEVFEEEEDERISATHDDDYEDLNALTPKALLELKAKMLTTLQKGIAEGKIDQLRALLASHGGGAKSFPEVDAKLFVGIEKALQNGALA